MNQIMIPLWRCGDCQKMQVRSAACPTEPCELCGATNWQPATEGALTTQQERAPVIITEGPGALLSAIVQLARDPAVDVTKLQALLAMQERMEARQAEIEFNRALARLPSIRVKKNGIIDLTRKDGTSGGSIAFAKWEDMMTIVEPMMEREGFRLMFDTTPRSGEGGGLIVSGMLLHRDGHSRTASIPLALDTGAGRNNVQAMGSSLSYGKRYTTEMLLNIVREGEDDDGKLAGTKFITEAQCAEIETLIKGTGRDRTKFLQVYGLNDVTDIEVGQFVILKNALVAAQRKG